MPPLPVGVSPDRCLKRGVFIWSCSKDATWLKPIASDSRGALNLWEEGRSRRRAVGNVVTLAWRCNNLLRDEFKDSGKLL